MFMIFSISKGFINFTFLLLLSVFSVGLSANEISILDFGATPNDYSDDDAIAINRAIQEAKEGDTIVIGGGKFHLRSEIQLKSHIKLQGDMDKSSVLAALFYGKDRSMIKGRYVSDVVIDGLTLKANRSDGIGRLIDIRYGNGVTVSNSKFYRFILHAVSLLSR